MIASVPNFDLAGWFLSAGYVFLGVFLALLLMLVIQRR